LWVVGILAGLAVVVALVLCIPVEMAFALDVKGRPRLGLKLVWLFGLVRREIGGEKGFKAEKKAARPKSKKKRRLELGTVLTIVGTRGLPGALMGSVRNVLRRFKVRDVVADFTVGLDNPADTGLFFALIGPAAVLVNYLTPGQVRLTPAFSGGAIIAGSASGRVRLRPVELVLPLLKAGFSLPTIRLIKALVWRAWKKKR